MPNIDKIKKWVEALRSGDYKQGQSYLHGVTGNGTEMFCCLGVACDLAIKDGVEIEVAETEIGFAYGDEQSFLPGQVRNYLGIGESDPKLLYTVDGVEQKYLATTLNDDMEYPFEDIADAIENTYLKNA